MATTTNLSKLPRRRHVAQAKRTRQAHTTRDKGRDESPADSPVTYPLRCELREMHVVLTAAVKQQFVVLLGVGESRHMFLVPTSLEVLWVLRCIFLSNPCGLLVVLH